MPKYMVLFNPLTHAENDYIPPEFIEGGVVGDTENGLLAVYDVPDGLEATFTESIEGCETVLQVKEL